MKSHYCLVMGGVGRDESAFTYGCFPNLTVRVVLKPRTNNPVEKESRCRGTLDSIVEQLDN